MKDEDIRKLLRSLPRRKASAEFTPRLLNRLDRLDRSSSEAVTTWRRARPLLAGGAALVLLGVLAFGGRQWHELRARAETARRIEALRNEYEALERELQELRSLAAASQPVVELGGTEDVDVLLDLRTLTQSTVRDPQARPIEYRR